MGAGELTGPAAAEQVMFGHGHDGTHTGTCDECGREFTVPAGDPAVPFRPTERETLIVGLFAYGWITAGRDTVLCPTHTWLLDPTDGISLTRGAPGAPRGRSLAAHTNHTDDHHRTATTTTSPRGTR